MKRIETKLSEKETDEQNLELPLATMVSQEYRHSNQNLRETLNSVLKVKRMLVVFVMFLLIVTSVMSSYIILYWDTMHPHAGAIQNKSD